MKTLDTIEVEGIKFELQEENGELYLVSQYDETPLTIERVDYNERDTVTTVYIDDAPYGLVSEYGAEKANEIIEQVCELLEERV